MGRFFFFLFFFFFGGEKPSWGLVCLFVCLFVRLFVYFRAQEIIFGNSIVNPSPLVKSNGSLSVGVVLVLTLLEYDQYDQRKKVHCPDYVFVPMNTLNCCQKTTAF